MLSVFTMARLSLSWKPRLVLKNKLDLHSLSSFALQHYIKE